MLIQVHWLTSAGTDVNNVLNLLFVKWGCIKLSIEQHDQSRVEYVQHLTCVGIIRSPT